MADSPRTPRRWPSSVLGVEVGPTHIRAYRGAGRGGAAEAVEMGWGMPPPAESVDALRERFGTGNILSVALDMSVVYAKRLDLPPLSMEERRKILTMDPRRYFPVRDEELVAGVRDDDLVVGASRETFDAWVEALGSLGSVERVEPAPAALVRHLAAHGSPEGVVVMEDSAGPGTTLITMAHGRIEGLRKVVAAAEELSALVSPLVEQPGFCTWFPWNETAARELADGVEERAGVVPVPSPPGAPASFAVARGAGLGIDGDPALTLVSPALERRTAALGRRRTALGMAALGFGTLLLGWSLDHRRAATLEQLEREVVAAQTAAAPVLELQERAGSLADRLSRIAAAAQERSSPLEVLETLTRVLPSHVHLTRVSASGAEWEVNGRARDAAPLIPLLEESTDLTNVRFRTATTRVRVGDEELENFTLVFRHVPST